MKYVLRGSLGGQPQDTFRSESFASEREALIRASQHFDKYGPMIVLEILMDDAEPALRDIVWMNEWNRTGRRLPAVERNSSGLSNTEPTRMTEQEKLRRDIDGLKESIRLDWVDLASKAMTASERKALHTHTFQP